MTLTTSFSSMNEKWLSRKLQREFQKVKLRSFEACALSSVPDLYAVIGRGMACWIELKVVNTIQSQIPFRKGQPDWIHCHNLDGGLTYLVVMIRRPQSFALLECSLIKQLQGVKMSSLHLSHTLGIFSQLVEVETSLIFDYARRISAPFAQEIVSR